MGEQSEWQAWERSDAPLMSAHLLFLELPPFGSFLAVAFALQ